MAGRPAYDRTTYLADIRALRARGLTYDAIARRLGMSRATLHRIIRDNRPPTRKRT